MIALLVGYLLGALTVGCAIGLARAARRAPGHEEPEGVRYRWGEVVQDAGGRLVQWKSPAA